MIGEKLEKKGWRQGSVLKEEDITLVLSQNNLEINDQLVVIVASQSCDIANNNLESDPVIELSISRRIEKTDGNLTFNKNPRTLHSTLLIKTETSDVRNELFVEFKAYEKLSIEKKYLAESTPDPNRLLENKQLEGYVSWLSARYFRPALPTEFNNRVSAIDPKNNRKKKAKAVNEQLSGIYVEIVPDAEISEDQTYRVNLLGLVPAGFNGDLGEAQSTLEAYAGILKQAGMDVSVVVRTEEQVSIAQIKKFKRFYYDDLSLKEGTPLPPRM